MARLGLWKNANSALHGRRHKSASKVRALKLHPDITKRELGVAAPGGESIFFLVPFATHLQVWFFELTSMWWSLSSLTAVSALVHPVLNAPNVLTVKLPPCGTAMRRAKEHFDLAILPHLERGLIEALEEQPLPCRSLRHETHGNFFVMKASVRLGTLTLPNLTLTEPALHTHPGPARARLRL